MNELIEFLRARLDEDEYIAEQLEPTGATARLGDHVESERLILDLHEWRLVEGRDGDGMEREGWFCRTCWGEDRYPCTTLRLLAAPYSDHPNYREEWKP